MEALPLGMPHLHKRRIWTMPAGAWIGAGSC